MLVLIHIISLSCYISSYRNVRAWSLVDARVRALKQLTEQPKSSLEKALLDTNFQVILSW